MTNTKMTMGQAVDAAISTHEKRYPGSTVHWAGVVSDDDDTWLVSVEADHFSTTLQYRVIKQVRS